MITFIDIESGNIFNGDKPYVFWFDKQQSVNINYVKKICFISDMPSIRVDVPENDVFYLLDLTKRDTTTEIDKREFFNLDNIVTHSIPNMNGVLYPSGDVNYYIYMLYILGCSSAAGTCTESLIINNSYEYTIGADFYNEDESLGIDLGNKGVDLSELFQRAIYGSNVHEDGRDNITSNRKLKEMCNEYMNIFANQGSYKSLANALKWFEYGDLLKTEEFWQYNQVDRDLLAANDMSQFVDEEIVRVMNDYRKTTYIGISLALQKILGCIIEGTTDWEKLQEPVPETKSIFDLGLSKWCVEDLAIKTAILGKILNDKFLPVHLNLLHSTVENVVFTNTIKISNAMKFERADEQYNIGTFFSSVQNDDIFYLDNVKARVYPDTMFGIDWEDKETEIVEGITKHLYSGEIFGVDSDDREYRIKTTGTTSGSDSLKTFMTNYFEGVGVIVPFECKIPYIDSSDSCVKVTIRRLHLNGYDESKIYNTRQECLLNGVGSMYVVSDVVYIYELDKLGHLLRLTSNTGSPVFADEGLVADEVNTYIINETKEYDTRIVKFNILLQEIGTYKYTIRFHYASGRDFIRTIRFEVRDNVKQIVNTYKITKKSQREIHNILNGLQLVAGNNPIDPIQLYQYNYTQTQSLGNVIYKQFLACDEYAIVDKLSTNQVIFIAADASGNINVTFNGNHSYIGSATSEIENMRNDFPEYYWYCYSRHTEFDESDPTKVSDSTRVYIVGICGNFTHREYLPLYNGDVKVVKDSREYSCGVLIDYNIHTHKINVTTNSAGVTYSVDGNSVVFKWDDTNISKTLTFDKIEDVWFEPSGVITHNLITSITGDRFWITEKFIPMLYDIEKVDVDEIVSNDIICFIPSITMTKRQVEDVKLVSWRFVNSTTGEEFIPKTYRSTAKKVPESPAIMGPLFGNYEYSLLPSTGYYDVYLKYRLSEKGEENEYSAKSEFLIRK